MRAKNVLYYGEDRALPGQTDLRAGPLHVIFEEGGLRSIRFGNREVLRRIYVAIRDQNWGTIPNELSNLKIDAEENSFRITFDVTNRAGPINFAWSGQILGEPDGSITFHMDGVANSTFLRNRIGFCVLHPAAYAGAPCKVTHIDASLSEARLPITIVPDQPVEPFANLRALAHQVEPDLWAKVQFAGDIFEMEDQRNWTDASFKTYCTPQGLPYPVEVKQGTRVAQSIRLTLLKGQVVAPAVVTDSPNNHISLSLDTGSQTLPLPPFGLGIASHGRPLDQHEIEHLRALHLNHLRVDLHLGEEGSGETLRQAVKEASALGVLLDVALLIPVDGEGSVRRLAALVARLAPPVRTWLVFPEPEVYRGGSATAFVLALAHRHLNGLVPGAQFASGTNTDLIFLQRNLPPLDQIDLVTFSINPQVHAFDNASIVETLEAQPQAVATARVRAKGLPVMVSPVTLKMRFNPYATGQLLNSRQSELPPAVDPRQMSLFGAGWTLGSIAALAQCGTASLTFYETTGWRGVMETSAGSLLPERFQSHPGEVFPMYHVFQALGEFAGGEVIPSRTTEPLVVSSLVLRKGRRTRILLANHTPRHQVVWLPKLRRKAQIHHIDETNVEDSMRNPKGFQSRSGAILPGFPDPQLVELLPYALTWLDE